jgi:hypothetical protein
MTLLQVKKASFLHGRVKMEQLQQISQEKALAKLSLLFFY